MTPKMTSITNPDGSKIYKSEIGQSELVNAREWFRAKVQGNRFFPIKKETGNITKRKTIEKEGSREKGYRNGK